MLQLIATSSRNEAISFSLWAMVAKHSKKNSQPQTWLRPGVDASAIHGRFGCSGCTPAEPYPPNRANKHTEPMWGTKPEKATAAAGLIQKNAQTAQTTTPVLPLNQIE